MLGMLFEILLFTTEHAAPGSEGFWSKFVHFWNDYANYPGFEAWKFLNLAVFLVVMYYLLKKPLSSAFIAKREAVRADLIRAEEEKQAAEKRLAEAEIKLAGLEAEKKAVIEKAKKEAEDEKKRIADQAAQAIAKMKDQAASEIERRRKQIHLELRRFSAEESVRLAEENIKRSMNAAKDAELVKASIKSIGGLS
jgi:F0F1-type ATP synthase membrane subunit b/b'